MYPYAYLFTAARFLGHASNPVSIWNLYSPSKELRAMILEVNNTYNERHIYFLKLQSAEGDHEIDHPQGKTSCYSTTFPKALYLSVFDSRTGTYKICATDALSPSMSGNGPINITIALSSTRTKLVGRLCSTSSGIDPGSLLLWEKTVFLAQWVWVGLATYFRTRVQAFILFYRKNITWVVKPQPSRESMPRRANKMEIFLEGIFRRYVHHVIKRTLRPVKVRYLPAGILEVGEEVVYSPSALQVEAHGEIQELEIRILTPLFYSRLLYYTFSTLSEIILAESQLLNQTLSLSDTDTVTTLFARNQQDNPYCQSTERLSYFDTYVSSALHFLNFLNGPKEPQNHHEQAPRIQTCETTSFPTHNFRFHLPREAESVSQALPLLAFLTTPQHQEQHGGCSQDERRIYTSYLLYQYLATHTAGGSTNLLRMEIGVVKFCLLWYLVRSLCP
ncbi:uncharacterized protein BP5553_05108 [Venustampulla echinocandica]|uniref:Uncharacterized protein n=1 Tax=Venustampulla echinocandica TaxID=2656787 RepID=A0A370TQ65_9HELO|nr:uncharacterized protein BP5553_05108 [Venustampulla echinocandica]RDL37675.1 hypothetical protein BP5553_05108 [Venustampulla echinocandica]